MPSVLIVGSGGREHALGWKLSQSPEVDKTFFASGNGGTHENIPVKPTDIERLLEFASKNACITVVGPEEPLSRGIVDIFEDKGLPIFGPSKDAARLETSKVWAKNFMKKHDIRTAKFAVFEEVDSAKDYVRGTDGKVVVKADGLAAGKGVIVCDAVREAEEALDRIMVNKEFGAAGNRVIIEEKLEGEEASFIVMTDGNRIISMASSQDHKRIYDGDKGPNTGGMGAYSPTPLIDEGLHEKIMKDIMQKAVSGMREESLPFRGFLYAGLMIRNGEPYVLEFNVRMGDPECQPIMMRMESDLYHYIDYCIKGKLDELEDMVWSRRSAICVVMASGGYPQSYEKGKRITGLDKTVTNTVVIFHAGTRRDNGNILTDGGRVLGVTALGDGIENAIKNVYNAVQKITWDGVHFRSDIGKKALRYLSKES